ncbi:helix-turn-helix transcriptional regulator [Achromobacter spanius]|uniref:AraC family transcriptional regulator n=1 Tax=Achromobacter spanius TaxID=217203 RepID=A0A2S0I6S7_9BURK|nr:AraC family transcriptional regulator [Achromobacter spanius]AVJ27740.1 AraC family transcriptional regulator [Achromobacter spanius]
MNYRLTAADISAPARIGQSPWQRYRLPADLGVCHTDFLRFDEGLTLAYTDYRPAHDLLEARRDERPPGLIVAIALEGESSNLGADGQRIDFVAGHSTIAAYGSQRGERRFPANRSIRQLRLIADAPLLHRYGLSGLLDDAGGVRAHPLFQGRHSAAIQRLAESLIHLHRQNGNLLDTYVAALGLLSEQVRPFTPPFTEHPPAAGKLRSNDQDRILRARDLMLEQFDRPLSIAYLCAAVGTNEFKLKQGFRELFGTSPYRLLTAIRMQKARELLESGVPASTAGYRVGFQHASSFSAAFERYYGRTPTSVARAEQAPGRRRPG